ncbi:MAG: class I SAM-dependent RNA methyltransferase [Acidobacteria bacterium]|nr:class I SAM-dependent RNA methyltransferase [Acidobacteriota bacterium]
MNQPEKNNPLAIEVGDILDVTIEKIVYGGDGLARYDANVILVPFTAPGERVRVRITSISRRILRAVLVELLTESECRVTPCCPHFGRCGGCQLQHLADRAQIEVKADFIRESLQRIGGIEWAGEIAIISGPSIGYRARTELKIFRDQEDRPRLGYFEPGTHLLCEIETCPILDPAIEREIGRLRQSPKRIPYSATRVYIAAGENGSVAVPGTGEDGERAAIDTRGTVHHRVNGFNYAFGIRSFFQGNRFLIDKLVMEVTKDVYGDRAVDLYAGVGLFSLQLATRFSKVCAVEGSPIAAGHGVQNSRRNNINNVEYHSLSVEAWLKMRSSDWKWADLLILDPPRAGAGPRVCEKITTLAPRMIKYVSCDPTTLSRDLKTLIANGYHIDCVTLVDMFPQTYHVETVVTLSPDH